MTNKADLSKYNIPLRTRTKVTRDSVSGRFTSEIVTHTKDGRTRSVLSAPSSIVKEVASKVINEHHEVIRRLAKR
ncbi:MAG: hypothetical protein ACTHOL_01525 [Luteibacter jiangsuensis]